jgi:hypothetical protein
MRLDILYQFIVPLTFLAIWALTSIFNREAQPLPPRPTPGPGPGGGPRQSGPLSRLEPTGPARYLGAQERIRGTSPELPAGARWVEPATSARAPSNRGAGDDEITILETETRIPRAAHPGVSNSTSPQVARAGRTGSLRRTARARSGAGSAPAKPTEPARPRALTSLIRQSMADRKARPLVITPLASPLTPIAVPIAESVSIPLAELPVPHSPAPSYSAAALRTTLTTESKLRELAVLSEILQPPVSVRRKKRLR